MLRTRKAARRGYTTMTALLAAGALVLTACGGAEGSDVSEGSDPSSGEEAAGDETTSDFPEQPITLLVGFGAGGANDLVARRIAPIMSEVLGQPIQVENMPGGAGVVATDEMLNRDHDGYTIVTHQFLSDQLEDLPFSEDDITVLGQMTDDPAVVGVPVDSPYESLEELNAAVEEGDVTAAHPGIRGLAGLATAYYELEQDLRFTHLTYDSGGDMNAAVLGGHTDSAFRAGGWYDSHPDELRILGSMSDEPVDDLEGVPTVEEATGVPMQFTAARGIAVPSDIPEDRMQILEDAFAEAAQSEEFQDGMLDELNFRPAYRSRVEAAELEDSMREIVGRLVDEGLLTDR